MTHWKSWRLALGAMSTRACCPRRNGRWPSTARSWPARRSATSRPARQPVRHLLLHQGRGGLSHLAAARRGRAPPDRPRRRAHPGVRARTARTSSPSSRCCCTRPGSRTRRWPLAAGTTVTPGSRRSRQWRLNWEPGTQVRVPPDLRALGARRAARARRRRSTSAPRCAAGCSTRSVSTRLGLGVPAAEQGDLARPVVVGEPPTAAEWEEVLGVPGFDLGEVTDDALVQLSRPEAVDGRRARWRRRLDCRRPRPLLPGAAARTRGELWDPAVLADAVGHVRNTFPDPQTGVPANRALSIVVAGDRRPGRDARLRPHASPRPRSATAAPAGRSPGPTPRPACRSCWLTNGLDRHLIRQWRRTAGIGSKAGAVAPT